MIITQKNKPIKFAEVKPGDVFTRDGLRLSYYIKMYDNYLMLEEKKNVNAVNLKTGVAETFFSCTEVHLVDYTFTVNS